MYHHRHGRDHCQLHQQQPNQLSPALAMLSGQGRSASSQQTHEMTVPNELIGCIIGKGGSKVAEIRSVLIQTLNQSTRDLQSYFLDNCEQAFKVRSCKTFIWHLDVRSDDLSVGLLYFVSGTSIFQTSNAFVRALTHFNKMFQEKEFWMYQKLVALSSSGDIFKLQFTACELQFWPGFRKFTKYFRTTQTTLGSDDPYLELRGQGRSSQPGQDHQHHGEHGVGGPGAVLDQHEVGPLTSLAYLRIVQNLTPSQRHEIAKHQAYSTDQVHPLDDIYISLLYIQCIYPNVSVLNSGSKMQLNLSYFFLCSQQELKDFQKSSCKTIHPNIL